MMCGKPVFRYPRQTLCAGNVIDVPVEEVNRIAIYRICDKCGKDSTTDPLMLTKPTQLSLPGFVSSQLFLF